MGRSFRFAVSGVNFKAALFSTQGILPVLARNVDSRCRNLSGVKVDGTRRGLRENGSQDAKNSLRVNVFRSSSLDLNFNAASTRFRTCSFCNMFDM